MVKISDKQAKLVEKLKELFQMDQADLDFGLYRIMNAKHDEIEGFLQDDLLPTIRTVLSQNGQAEAKKQELAELVKTLQAAGMNPDDSPKVQELKALLGDGAAASIERDEDEIFSQLTTFFGRYYEGGDFMSLRRYKKETYSPLPMNGEEVKLHWANADQYYIKSAENFQTYAFKVGTGDDQIKIRFELVKACTEQNNNKAATGKERRFMLNQETAFTLACEDGHDVLVLPFCYVPDGQKRTQKVLNGEALAFIAGLEGDEDVLAQVKDQWAALQAALLTLAPTEKNKKRTAFEKHLGDYTARNSFDYFIHKNLGGFLRRELDFFIKNEMLYLDDIIPVDGGEVAARALSNEIALKKLVAFKTIASKIIAFLAQLEEFQKKLWLKKKFVLETNYCFTLDRVPEAFYGRIAQNQAQVQEWVDLGFIEDGAQVTGDFLKKNPFLVLDTGRFDADFKAELLAQIEEIDEKLDGLLVHSENFQALNVMQEKYREQVKCIYIDPPYNTNSTPILYKNEYKHSSWSSLIQDRLSLSMPLLKDRGVKVVAIDDSEVVNLSILLQRAAPDHRMSRITVVQNPKGSITKDFNRTHEYALFLTKKEEKGVIARTLEKNETPRKLRRWGENSLRTERRLSFYPIYIKGNKIVRVGTVPDDNYHPSGKNETKENHEIAIWPIDQNAVERRWNFGLDTIEENIDRIIIEKKDDEYDLFLSHELTVPKTVWTGGDFDAGNHGNTLLINLLGRKIFDFPKSIKTVERCIHLGTDDEDNPLTLDYFAGSGTTAHATINLNREDGGKRKYILVEMGNYFDSVLMPRIKKVVFSEKWKDGKPVSDTKASAAKKGKDGSLGGISHAFKYIRLESYEDVMDNLALTRTPLQDDMLVKHDEFRQDYMLHYMLDIEAKGSLLSPKLFQNPFAASMKVVRDNEARNQNIDLVETFNWLLGLTVTSTRKAAKITEVIGRARSGENILILWRTLDPESPDYTDNDALDAWFNKQDYNTRDMEFDLIYVNGDNNLPNLKKTTENWKVQLIEHTFETLMFDVADV